MGGSSVLKWWSGGDTTFGGGVSYVDEWELVQFQRDHMYKIYH